MANLEGTLQTVLEMEAHEAISPENACAQGSEKVEQDKQVSTKGIV